MLRRLAMTVSLVLMAGGSALPLHAQPKPDTQACFRAEDWTDWKASPDSRSIYLRVNLDKVFRLELTDACPELQEPNARLITDIRGTNYICSPLDLDLRVADPTLPRVAVPCIVKSISKLTPDQVAALPKGSRP